MSRINPERLPCRDEFTKVLLEDAQRALTLYREQMGHRLTGDVLDIGAHHGTFALSALEGGARFVLCVEASSENFAGLSKNIEASGFGPHRLPAIEAAAWEGPEGQQLSLRRTAGNNSGQFSLCFDPARYAESDRPPSVPFTRLLRDAWWSMRRAAYWDYVKIDVEGAEWSWLTGPEAAARSITQFRFLDLELHPLSNAEYYPTPAGEAFTLSDVDQWFRSAGCRIVWREESPTRLFIIAP